MKSLIKFQNQNEILFFICNCYNEVLVINYDKSYKIADLCIYESYNSYSHKLSFWHKIKTILHILRTGKIYSDQISLDSDQIEKLKMYLSYL